MRPNHRHATRPVSGADEQESLRRALLKVGATAAGDSPWRLPCRPGPLADGSDSGARS